MAAEALRYYHQENKSITNKASERGKEVVLWAAEKSIYLTAPLTAVLLLTGAISVPVAVLALGGDVATSKIAGNMRKKK